MMRRTLEYVTDGETLFEATYDVCESGDLENFGCTDPVGRRGDRRPGELQFGDVIPIIPGREWRYVRELVDARSDYAVDEEDLFAVHNTTWPIRQAA